MPDSPQLEYDTSFPTASADITDIRQSFHRSFLSTVKQHFMRTTVNQPDKPDPDAPQAPPLALIPPNRISGTGEGERHFVGDPGFSTPANLAALQSLGALGVISAWTGDTFVTLGDGSTAWWNGTAWVAGKPGA